MDLLRTQYRRESAETVVYQVLCFVITQLFIQNQLTASSVFIIYSQEVVCHGF